MLEALFVAIPVALTAVALVSFGVALAVHPFAAQVGWRYLRSKKRRTVSVITGIAIVAVALGVAALLAVMSITSGFQEEFRNKVLGVNAHVLVLKYGLDFSEYDRVIERSMEMPEVAGAAPFLIQEMMIAKGDRIAGVLVKGVDPERMPTVLDLPSQIIDGSLRNLRVAGASPPVRPSDLIGDIDAGEATSLDEFLRALDEDAAEGEPRAMDLAAQLGVPEPIPDEAPPAADVDHEGFEAPDELPEVDVPSPEDINDLFAGDDDGDIALPDDGDEDIIFEELDLLDEENENPDEALPGIVVGTTLAETLGLGVGDRVSVISPLAGIDRSFLGDDVPSAPRSREFRVISIFSAGFQEYDSRLVYVDLYEAQRFSDHGDSVTGVELRLHDLDASHDIARRLERVLGAGPYHTMDWRELNRNLFTALEIQKIMLSLVIATIIFIAAFNVVVTLIMIVLEKKREIAILKAMGAKNISILLVFMVQGVLIGLAGTAIGLLLGGGVCLYLESFQFPLDPHVYLIDHLPVRTSALEFLLTVCFALLICMLATVLPSSWAARLLPAEGVRYE